MLTEIRGGFKILASEVLQAASETRELLRRRDPSKSRDLYHRTSYIATQSALIQKQALELYAGRSAGRRDSIYLQALSSVASRLERVSELFLNLDRQAGYLGSLEFLQPFRLDDFFHEILFGLGRIEPALERKDLTLAIRLGQAEERLDGSYADRFAKIIEELKRGVSDPGDLVTALMIVHYLERVGDMLLEIGEKIIYVIMGEKIKLEQYKAIGAGLKATGSRMDTGRMGYRSIWGGRSGCRIGVVDAIPAGTSHGVGRADDASAPARTGPDGDGEVGNVSGDVPGGTGRAPRDTHAADVAGRHDPHATDGENGSRGLPAAQTGSLGLFAAYGPDSRPDPHAADGLNGSHASGGPNGRRDRHEANGQNGRHEANGQNGRHEANGQNGRHLANGHRHSKGRHVPSETVLFKHGPAFKLTRERENLVRWAALRPGLTPAVKAFIPAREGSEAALVLEYIPCRNLQALFMDNAPDEAFRGLDAALAIMCGIWDETAADGPCSAEFARQAEGRISEARCIYPQIIKFQGAVGNMEIRPVEELLPELSAMEAESPAPRSMLIHGDFNLSNILYDPGSGRVHMLDLYRSRESDYVQDVSVMLVSILRLPILSQPVRRRLAEAAVRTWDAARRFAVRSGDDTYEARLAFGLGRSFLTSTRFILDERMAARFAARARYLFEKLLAFRARGGTADGFRLSRDILEIQVA
ncbi:MAG: phosphotransferase [Deltaproteobacteria bacterium]|jgi:phosphate uptake regulator/aminoglycoside phosphotransferase (APT) family kinase protein|nr:phosphotransferase [Deltaproteobacteria bacterium]